MKLIAARLLMKSLIYPLKPNSIRSSFVASRFTSWSSRTTMVISLELIILEIVLLLKPLFDAPLFRFRIGCFGK